MVAGRTARAGLDPEALQRVHVRHREAASGAIERHGGAVESVLADRVVGVFGIPRVHEDDPLRAARAAVELLGEAGPTDPRTLHSADRHRHRGGRDQRIRRARRGAARDRRRARGRRADRPGPACRRDAQAPRRQGSRRARRPTARRLAPARARPGTAALLAVASRADRRAAGRAGQAPRRASTCDPRASGPDGHAHRPRGHREDEAGGGVRTGTRRRGDRHGRPLRGLRPGDHLLAAAGNRVPPRRPPPRSATSSPTTRTPSWSRGW